MNGNGNSVKARQLDGLLAGYGETPTAVRVQVMYQDAATLKWAKEMSNALTTAAGERTLRFSWWRIGELQDPAVFAGAVTTAMRSRLIVVALHASDHPPLSLCMWVNSWLPFRSKSTESILSLVSLPSKLQPTAVQEYMRSVAREGRLNMLMEERMLKKNPVLASA